MLNFNNVIKLIRKRFNVKILDKRNIEFLYQRFKYGFDDSETWSLYTEIAEFILPRLKRFKEVKTGYPSTLKSMEEWDNILDQMICSFELAAKEDYMSYEERQKYSNDQLQRGFDLFSKYYFDLWW